MDDICEYIARDSEYYGKLFGQRMLKTVEFIEQNPLLGSVVAEYQQPDLRERILQNYRIVYRYSEARVELVTLCHAARLLHVDPE